MDPTFRDHESGDNLKISIDRDRSFQEMFSDFTGSFRKIMAAIPAGETGWIDGGYGNYIVNRIKKVHGFLECKTELNGFYATEKFLKCREMGDFCKIEQFRNSPHIPNIFDEFSIMLVPKIFEKNEDKKLILSVNLLWKFVRIRGYSGWRYYWLGGLDKPDIPACRSFSCLLAIWTHIQVRRHCTLDLSVVGTPVLDWDFYRAHSSSPLPTSVQPS